MLERSMFRKALIPVFALLVSTSSYEQTPAGDSPVKALQHGGYVLLMRHAAAPLEAPSREAADPENLKDERQLDEKGKATAIAMGRALKELKIPIGEVLSSPTYRALETVKYLDIGTARTSPELGEGDKGMQGGTAAQGHWLEGRVRQFPRGTNTLIVTHNPNLISAFPQFAVGVADGETLVFAPDGRGGATLVARIKIEQWSSLRP